MRGVGYGEGMSYEERSEGMGETERREMREGARKPRRERKGNSNACTFVMEV